MGLNGTVDYSNGLIYKLCCKDPNITDIYIGSTTNMRNRKNRHKSCCNNPNDQRYNLKVYKFIRENGGWDNWDLILVEYVNCNSKQELLKEERVVIELLKSNLNSHIPTRTMKEWYEEHKEQLQEYSKNYYNEKKTKLIEKQKNYDKKNKEQIKEYKKIYREKNKNKINEQQQKIREVNKTEINEKLRAKVKCEFCECLVNKSSLKRHQQTISCKKFQIVED